MQNSSFEWQNEMVTGISEIDLQHFSLVEVINDMLQMIFSNEKIDLVQVEEMSLRLNSYIVNHFATEEKLMRRFEIDSRHVEIHIKEHMDFIENLTRYFSDVQALVNPNKLGEVCELLIKWLSHHILNVDKSLSREINFLSQKRMIPYDHEEFLIQMDESAESSIKAYQILYQLLSQKNKDLELANRALEEKIGQLKKELRLAYTKLEKLSK